MSYREVNVRREPRGWGLLEHMVTYYFSKFVVSSIVLLDVILPQVGDGISIVHSHEWSRRRFEILQDGEAETGPEHNHC